MHVTFDNANDLNNSFQAEGKYQFSYKLLKSSLLNNNDDASQEAVQPIPEPKPTQPNHPEQPLQQPQSCACPKPPWPRTPSTHTAAAKACAATAETAKLECSDDEKSSKDEAEVNEALTVDPPDEEVHIASGEDPHTYRETMNSPDHMEWKQAMRDDLDSIMQLDNYKLVELPPDHEVINTKWVYHIKHDKTGHITRYKVRLVTHGFPQKPGIDFDETFASVARI